MDLHLAGRCTGAYGGRIRLEEMADGNIWLGAEKLNGALR